MATLPENTWVWAQRSIADNTFVAGQLQVGGAAPGMVRLRLANETLVECVESTVRPIEHAAIEGVDDLVKLGELHVGALCHTLEQRYRRDMPYTAAGHDILVALNPNKSLPIYDDIHAKLYRNAEPSEHPPHIYAMAKRAYATMMRSGENQCVVISGESGAGKTESTKYIVHFLAEMSRRRTRVLAQILDGSPILEAFGNAKTVRNDNSSRFGKFLELLFERQGNIVGSKTRHYLLEKSRIVFQSPDERNFHLFYYLVAGAPIELREELMLTEFAHYRYLNQSAHHTLPHDECTRKFNQLCHAIHTLDISDTRSKSVWSAVAAVLHLGNVQFAPNSDDAATVTDVQVLGTVAKLLNVNIKKLLECLTTRTTSTRDETILTPLTVSQAADTRDALAKTIYERIFAWFVNHMNRLTEMDDKDGDIRQSSIGVLGMMRELGLWTRALNSSTTSTDIFGFEQFKINSFEQLCINFANEHLHFYFAQCVFKMEQDEFAREGLTWANVEYADNQAVIDLLGKRPTGLFIALNEESLFPNATDQTLLAKFHQKFNGQSVYIKPKTQAPQFTVTHYAGDVTYTVEKWLDKNRDSVPVELTDMMRGSRDTLVKEWFQERTSNENEDMLNASINGSNALGMRRSSSAFITLLPSTDNVLSASNSPLAGGARRKTPRVRTVAHHFTNSLNNLVSTLLACRPTFIRCIKTNISMESNKFEGEFVREQLRYSGMLETVKIRQGAAPYRMPYSDFFDRYGALVPTTKLDNRSDKDKCRQIIIALMEMEATGQWQAGQSKVFMNSKVFMELERILAIHRVRPAVILQRWYRRVRARRSIMAAVAQIAANAREKLRVAQEIEDTRRRAADADAAKAAEEAIRGRHMRTMPSVAIESTDVVPVMVLSGSVSQLFSDLLTPSWEIQSGVNELNDVTECLLIDDDKQQKTPQTDSGHTVVKVPGEYSSIIATTPESFKAIAKKKVSPPGQKRSLTKPGASSTSIAVKKAVTEKPVTEKIFAKNVINVQSNGRSEATDGPSPSRPFGGIQLPSLPGGSVAMLRPLNSRFKVSSSPQLNNVDNLPALSSVGATKESTVTDTNPVALPRRMSSFIASNGRLSGAIGPTTNKSSSQAHMHGASSPPTVVNTSLNPGRYATGRGGSSTSIRADLLAGDTKSHVQATNVRSMTVAGAQPLASNSHLLAKSAGNLFINDAPSPAQPQNSPMTAIMHSNSGNRPDIQFGGSRRASTPLMPSAPSLVPAAESTGNPLSSSPRMTTKSTTHLSAAPLKKLDESPSSSSKTIEKDSEAFLRARQMFSNAASKGSSTGNVLAPNTSRTPRRRGLSRSESANVLMNHDRKYIAKTVEAMKGTSVSNVRLFASTNNSSFVPRSHGNDSATQDNVTEVPRGFLAERRKTFDKI